MVTFCVSKSVFISSTISNDVLGFHQLGMSWISNCSHDSTRDVLTHPNFNGDSVWPPLNLGHGRAITSHCLHRRNSVSMRQFRRCFIPLHWRHNDYDGVSNHQPHGCLLNRLFRRRSKETSKLRVTGLCPGTSPGPVNSPHKWPVTRKMFPFDDVIMSYAVVKPWKHSIPPGDSLGQIISTVKPVCNDHLYNKIYYLYNIQ